MKHLKLFENYESKFYSKVDKMDFSSDYLEENFDDDYISKIRSKIEDIIKNRSTRLDTYFRVFKIYNGFDIVSSTSHSPGSSKEVFIQPLEDEWFYVCYYINIGEFRHKKEFYMCDQIDGLLKFIEDKVITERI